MSPDISPDPPGAPFVDQTPTRPPVPPDAVGVVGSPSSTNELTVDLTECASGQSLLGDLVFMSHPLTSGRHLLGLGTISEIQTRNRWHEDPNMRGVLRVHGSLPHLSADGDVRTAIVRVQAVYDTDQPSSPFTEPPRESGGTLGMSPTTGAPVCKVTDDLISSLTAGHAHEVIYLGRVYRGDVLLPMYVRQFTDAGVDGAYHTGIFGRSGSGKTAFASYLIAAQLRHKTLSVFVFDPQGQFTTEHDLPVRLQALAARFGRPVEKLSLAEDLRLPKDARLMGELLDQTRFFVRLAMKTELNREIAGEELTRLLRDRPDDWTDQPAEKLLRDLLTALSADNAAMARIYSSPQPRARVKDAIDRALAQPGDFAELLREWAPVQALFSPTTAGGKPRKALAQLIEATLDRGIAVRPYVIVDLSSRSGNRWLDSADVKARLLRKIVRELRDAAERAYAGSGRLLNCLVVFDEAARFANAHSDSQQAAQLAARLVDHVRETRKTGLGWTFITQEINALHPGIYAQLSIRAFGYGLTTGSDLARLADEVGHGAGLQLYQSFTDPRAMTEKVYPFMLTGPVSPLSFTAAPVFLQVFTSESEFIDCNRRHRGRR